MTVSPVLLDRLDRLSSCRGHWVLIQDGEPLRDCSHHWHQSPDDLLAQCLASRWRDVSLAFVPSWLGFSDYGSTGLVGLSNFRVFTDTASTPDPHDAVHVLGYGWNGQGVALDVRLVTDEMIESIEALESYPLLSEDDHSALEFDSVLKSWESDSVSDRIDELKRYGLSIFAARHSDAPWRDGFDALREAIVETLNQYPTAAA